MFLSGWDEAERVAAWTSDSNRQWVMIIHLHPSENTEYLSTWKPSLSTLRAIWIPLRSPRIFCLWRIPATCFILLESNPSFILFELEGETALQPNLSSKLKFTGSDLSPVRLSVCSSDHRHSSRWGLQCEWLSGVPELWSGGRANTCPHLEEGEFLYTNYITLYSKILKNIKYVKVYSNTLKYIQIYWIIKWIY